MSAGRLATGRWPAAFLLLLTIALAAAACGSSGDDNNNTTAGGGEDSAGGGEDSAGGGEDSAGGGEDSAGGGEDSAEAFDGTLRLGAIPDQDPEKLQRTYELLADYLEEALPDITVDYVPVTDYQGAVNGFRAGDLDIVWFGGLTGVQARLEVPGAMAIAQRDIDAVFTSVFIANTSTGIEPFDDVDGLTAVAGTRFTFGSESSTSGRLMPQSFLGEAGIDPETDFDGPPGFSGSHDATIEQVAAGTYETGALNSQVWDARREEGTVDDAEVIEIYRTDTYVDYHWLARPDVDEKVGSGFTEAFAEALFALDASDPEHAAILDLFGAGGFIPTDNDQYDTIEEVGREAGLINQP